MTFRVGQKVVCVHPVDDLVKDAVYEVLAIGLSWRNTQMLDVNDSQFGCLAFYAWRFRPLVERKTDISIFTAMLNPSKVKA